MFPEEGGTLIRKVSSFRNYKSLFDLDISTEGPLQRKKIQLAKRRQSQTIREGGAESYGTLNLSRGISM